MNDQAKPDFSQIPNQAIKVITNPAGFFREMPKTGGFVEPLVFVAVMALVSGVLTALLSLVGFGMAGTVATGLAAVILVPIFAVIGSFIGAAIIYVIWMIMGSKESYETAYRCVAYMTAIYPITALLHIIPYAGGVIGTAWGFYLLIVASTEVHGIKAQTAYIVFGIIGALMILFQLRAEYTTRHLSAQMAELGKSMENMQNMSPEEAGKAVGDFLKGMEQSQKKDQQQ
jgi:hypothetical protein